MTAGVLENLSDEELAGRSRAGSAASFEEIVRRHQVPLMRFLNRRFPSRRDAEDILQDTFVQAWQALHRYDPAYAFRTWLYTIAYRLAVSRGRRDALARAAVEAYESPDDVQPGAAAEREEGRGRLWSRARQMLTEEQYMALWLFYVDEMPAADVARIMNRSWVSVKTMLHRARKRLAPALAEEGYGTVRVGVTDIPRNRAPGAAAMKAGEQ